jgi:hypothetical protein
VQRTLVERPNRGDPAGSATLEDGVHGEALLRRAEVAFTGRDRRQRLRQIARRPVGFANSFAAFVDRLSGPG